MLSLFFSWLLPLLLAIEGLPESMGGGPQLDQPASSVAPNYFEVLEQNSHLVYPGLALLTLGLMAFGILQAWRTQDMSASAKTEYRKLIVDELRRNPVGVSGNALSRALGLDRHRTLKLLEEMQEEGLILSYNNSQRITVWRMKGVGVRY